MSKKKLPTPKEQQPVVVTVAIPCHDMCQSMWAYDLAGMLTYTVAALGDRIGIRILMIQNTYIQKAREELVVHALEQGTHYILFVDSDMRFPKESLVTLLAHDKDVVGVNYSTRGHPPQFVAISTRHVPDGEGRHRGEDHSLRSNRHPTFADSTGLEKVHAIGGGLNLLKAKIFEDLPRPWFSTISMPDGSVIGEDVHFCRQLEEAGIDVWLDQDLSKMIGHIGQMVFMTEHAEDMWHNQKEYTDGSNIV